MLIKFIKFNITHQKLSARKNLPNFWKKKGKHPQYVEFSSFYKIFRVERSFREWDFLGKFYTRGIRQYSFTKFNLSCFVFAD